MSLVEEQNAFLLDVCKLIRYAADNGWVVTGGELFRTLEQQELHFKAGRSKTMNSNHLRRLAIDLNFFKGGVLVRDAKQLVDLGTYWESLHPKNRWGGNWKFVDSLHFERNV